MRLDQLRNRDMHLVEKWVLDARVHSPMHLHRQAIAIWPELRSDGCLAKWSVMLYNLERQIHTPGSELDIYHRLDVASRIVLWNSSIVGRPSAGMVLLDLEDNVWSVSREMILSDVGHGYVMAGMEETYDA